MTDGTAAALADALRDRYTFERELARGGMAVRFARLMFLFATIALLGCSRHRTYGVPQDHPTTSRRDTTVPEPELPSPPR